MLSDSSAVLSGEMAFALYRIGCFFCFMSTQHRAALEASGLVEHLCQLATPRLPHLTARDTTLALDALARLGFQSTGSQPLQAFVAGLATRAGQLAGALEASQLPLVLWALAAIGSPSPSDLGALDSAVARHAAAFSAQGVSLVLWAYAALRHHPGDAPVRALAAAVSAQLPRMCPSELARSCAALSVLGGRLPDADVAAIASRACIPVGYALESRAAGGAASPHAEAWAAAAAHAPLAVDVMGLLPLRAGGCGSLGDAADAASMGGRWLLASRTAASPPLQLKLAA